MRISPLTPDGVSSGQGSVSVVSVAAFSNVSPGPLLTPSQARGREELSWVLGSNIIKNIITSGWYFDKPRNSLTCPPYLIDLLKFTSQ